MNNNFDDLIKLKSIGFTILCSSFAFLLILLINVDQIDSLYAAKINGPVITKNIGGITGSDIFKISIGLTNLYKNSGIVKVCLTSLYNNDSKICNLVDASREYSEDFPLHNCASCIISAGTYIFPKGDVPINSEIQACVYSLNSLQTNCDRISNSPINKIEDLVLEIR